jgi:hypothetical protein
VEAVSMDNCGIICNAPGDAIRGKEPGLSEQVVYLDRFQLQAGKSEDFKSYATGVASFVEQNEPGAISFNYYLDESGAKGTALFVFADADALDIHLDLLSARFQEG